MVWLTVLPVGVGSSPGVNLIMSARVRAQIVARAGHAAVAAGFVEHSRLLPMLIVRSGVIAERFSVGKLTVPAGMIGVVTGMSRVHESGFELVRHK